MKTEYAAYYGEEGADGKMGGKIGRLGKQKEHGKNKRKKLRIAILQRRNLSRGKQCVRNSSTRLQVPLNWSVYVNIETTPKDLKRSTANI